MSGTKFDPLLGRIRESDLQDIPAGGGGTTIIQEVTGGGGGEPSASGYSLANGPEYGATYVYVGLDNTDGSWYIYRRTISDNTRLYANGSSDYATNWTNRASLTYA